MVTPEDVLAVAQTLRRRWEATQERMSPAQAEALARVVASRLYYAAFTRATVFAERHDYEAPAALGMHEALWAWYRQKGQLRVEHRGTQLRRLRILADYRPEATPAWNLADAEGWALELFRDLDALEAS